MPHGVLGKRLEREARNERGLRLRADRDVPAEPLPEPELLEGQVFADDGGLLADRHEGVGRAERIAEQAPQGVRQSHRLRRFFEEGGARDGVQRVEKEMRPDLVLEVRELRGLQGRLRPHQFAFLLAQLAFKFRLAPQVLHHRPDIAAHRVERTGKRFDLVARHGDDLLDVQVPLRDAGGGFGQTAYRRRDRTGEGDGENGRKQGDEREGRQGSDAHRRGAAGYLSVALFARFQVFRKQQRKVTVDVGRDSARRRDVLVVIPVARHPPPRGGNDESGVGFKATARRLDVEEGFKRIVLGVLGRREFQPDRMELPAQVLIRRGHAFAEEPLGAAEMQVEIDPEPMHGVIARKPRLEFAGGAVGSDLDREIQAHDGEHRERIEAEQLGPDTPRPDAIGPPFSGHAPYRPPRKSGFRWRSSRFSVTFRSTCARSAARASR